MERFQSALQPQVLRLAGIAFLAAVFLASSPAFAQSEEEETPPPAVQQEEDSQGLQEIEDIEEVPEAQEEEAPAGEAEEIPALEELSEVPALEEVPEIEKAPAAEEPPAEEAPEAAEAPAAEPAPVERNGVELWNSRLWVEGVVMLRAAHTGSDPSLFPRYTTDKKTGGSTTVFDVPYAALALTADFTKDWRFYLHVGHSNSLDDDTTPRHYDSHSTLEIYEAYVQYALHSDFFHQPFYVRAGRIAPWGLSLAHRGPLRTSTWFVMPSPISTFLNNIYAYGADLRFGFEEGKDPVGGFAAGIVEGNSAYALPFDPIVNKHFWPVTDIMTAPHGDNADFDTRAAAYAYATVRDSTKRLRAHMAYYTNGVQRDENNGTTLRLATGGLDVDLWGRGNLQFQMANGESFFRGPLIIFNTSVQVPELQFDGFFVALHVPAGEHHLFSARYDEFTIKYAAPLLKLSETSLGYTLNYTYVLNRHHRFSAEYVKIDTQEWNPLGTDAGDDMTILNYVLSF